MLGPNCSKAKDVKSCTYCYQKERLEGMPWLQTCATHYHAQLGLPDKGRSINDLVVCYVVWLGSRCVVQFLVCGQDGYRALVPQHPIDTYIIYTYHIINIKSRLKMECISDKI